MAVKLSRLLEQHLQFSKAGLSGCLGDGYLVSNNRIYRNVREAALNAGYKFTSEKNDAYETFPLLHLETLLTKKQIPYSKNAAAFESLSPVAREAMTWEDIEGNLKKNFVFHEACHGLARSLALKHMGPNEKGSSLQAHRAFALRMLLEESCANTCEFIGVIDATDQVHRIFYEIGSYVCEFESRTYLKNAFMEIGASTVTKFMVLSYLQANHLRTSIDEKSFKRMVELTGTKSLTAQQSKTLRALGKVAFNLSERFRIQTTAFHLRLNGIATKSTELFDFDFLAALEGQKGFANFLESLTLAISK
jgi:hypothetical protein